MKETVPTENREGTHISSGTSAELLLYMGLLGKHRPWQR